MPTFNLPTITGGEGGDDLANQVAIMSKTLTWGYDGNEITLT